MSPIERGRILQRLRGNQDLTSGLEDMVRGVLDQWRVEYIPQLRISIYFVDFYIPSWNLVLEVHGCYWHSCALCDYQNVERWESDAQRLNFITAAGYRVAVLWEHDIRRNAEEVLLPFGWREGSCLEAWG